MPVNNDTNNNSFNIKEFLITVLNKWYLFFIIMIPCVALSLIYSYFVITPLYDSTGKIYIVNKNSQDISSGDLSVSSYLTRDYENLISDRAVLDDVAKKLDYKYSASYLQGCLSVENPTNTRFIEITVRTPNAEDSKKIVDYICEVSQEKIVDLLGIDRVTIVRNGNLSRRPSVPNVSSNLLKASFFGLILYLTVIIAIFFFNDKINSPEDVQKYLDMSVLGVIPYNQAKAK